MATLGDVAAAYDAGHRDGEAVAAITAQSSHERSGHGIKYSRSLWTSSLAVKDASPELLFAPWCRVCPCHPVLGRLGDVLL
jgi:hypothetical protein